jgi:hypothetical protein
MSTLKEQLDAEREARNRPHTPEVIEKDKPARFGNPYRDEYIKNAEVIQEKLAKRGKSARPSKKSKMR